MQAGAVLEKPFSQADYLLLAAIGGEPDCQVFRARSREDGRIVAVRLIQQSHLAVFGSTDVLRKAELQRRISHPALAATLAYGKESDDTWFIVSEYVDAPRLDAWADTLGIPPLPDIIDMVHRICQGLQAAHRLGLVHDSLHPGNIAVLPRQPQPNAPLEVKVLDLSVPAIVRPWPPSLRAAAFMAPEQLRLEELIGTEADVRSNVYACGALLYYLCTGGPPYSAHSLDELAALQRSGRLTPPSRINPALPAGLEEAILRALNPDPLARFPTIAELANALALVRLPLRLGSRSSPPKATQLPRPTGFPEHADFAAFPADSQFPAYAPSESLTAPKVPTIESLGVVGALRSLQAAPRPESEPPANAGGRFDSHPPLEPEGILESAPPSGPAALPQASAFEGNTPPERWSLDDSRAHALLAHASTPAVRTPLGSFDSALARDSQPSISERTSSTSFFPASPSELLDASSDHAEPTEPEILSSPTLARAEPVEAHARVAAATLPWGAPTTESPRPLSESGARSKRPPQQTLGNSLHPGAPVEPVQAQAPASSPTLVLQANELEEVSQRAELPARAALDESLAAFDGHPPSVRGFLFWHWTNLSFLSLGLMVGALLGPLAWVCFAFVESAALWIVPDLPRVRRYVLESTATEQLTRERSVYLRHLFGLQGQKHGPAQRLLGLFIERPEADIEARIIDQKHEGARAYRELKLLVAEIKKIARLRAEPIRVHEQLLDRMVNRYLGLMLIRRMLNDALLEIDREAELTQRERLEQQLAVATPAARIVLSESLEACHAQLAKLRQLETSLQLASERAESARRELRELHRSVMGDPAFDVTRALALCLARPSIAADPFTEMHRDPHLRDLLVRPT